VVDADGRTLGSVERGVVRVLGLRTFAVHLSGRSAAGGFWVQQRAFDKATEPGGVGHADGRQMAAGESIEATLERETDEEAGLRSSSSPG
jgi:8-oxo-dGTP pyrophosphatase MutT (NUDIX family)